MDLASLLQVTIIACYFLGCLLYLVGALGQKPRLRWLANILAGLGFGLHTLDLGLLLHSHLKASLVQSEFYLSLFAWSLLLIFFILWWKLRFDFLALIASPLALLLFLSSLALDKSRLPLPESLSGLFFGLHIGSLFLSISFLAMAFGAGVGYLFIEKKIKTKEKLKGFIKTLPSLSTFDKANHFAVMTGFPLYTLGLLSGFIWARLTWGKVFSWDPKEVVAVVNWLLFAFLFHQRLAMGWRGRKTALMAIWVFVLTLVSMLGVNFLLNTHHSFKS